MNKPYFQDEWATIYHGDCREILPQLTDKVDLVLTDPPYGIDGAMSGMQKIRGKCEYYAGSFEDTEDNLRTAIIPFVVQLIATIPAVVLTPGNRHFSLYPQPQSFGVFYQPCAVAVQTFGNLDAQPIFYYGKNPRNERLGVTLSWLVTERPEEFGHPCTKPIRVWKKLLASVSKDGQLILDPFMGSGTTLKAAKV